MVLLNRKQFSQNRREYIDSFYLMLLQGVNKIIPLLVLPYLMKTLGPSGYGYVGFAVTTIQFIVLLVDFGFDLSATKHVARVENREELTRVFWSVVCAKTLLLLSSIVVLSLLILFVPTMREYGKAIICTLPMAVGSAYTFMWMYQGIGKVRYMAVINTLSKILLLPLIFVLVKGKDDFLIASFLQSSVFLLTAFVSCFWLWRMKVVDHFVYSPTTIKTEMAESLPLFMSRAATSVYTSFFVILLGFLSTSDTVGKYSSSENIMRALCFILYIPLTQAFYPKICALEKENRQHAVETFQTVRNIVFLCMLAVSVSLFFGAPFLLRFLGNAYEGFDEILRIMSVTPIFIGLGAVYGQMGLIALGNQKTKRDFRNTYYIVACVALILVSLLTPLFSAVGAAIALVLSEALVFFLMFYFYRKSNQLT